MATINILPTLHKRVRLVAAERGEKIKVLIHRAIELELDRPLKDIVVRKVKSFKP